MKIQAQTAELSKKQLQDLVDTIPGAAVVYRVVDQYVGRVCYNQRLQKVCGYDDEEFAEVVQRDAVSLVDPSDRFHLVGLLHDIIHGGGEMDYSYRIHNKAQGTIWVNAAGRCIGKLEGHPLLLCLLKNLTEEQGRINLNQDLIEKIPAGVGVYDIDNKTGQPDLIFLNDGYYEIMGTNLEECREYFGTTTIKAVHPDDVEPVLGKLRQAVTGNGKFQMKIRIIKPKTAIYKWLLLDGKRIQNLDGKTRMYMVYTDVDELEQAKEHLKFLAEHDPLTGLCNRLHFFAKTKAMLEQHPEGRFAFLRLDVDRFRLLNSFWGEKEGDKFICYCAEQLQQLLTTNQYSTFGHIDADIFGVCMLYEPKQVKEQLQKLVKKLQEFDLNTLIEPSIGVYVIEDNKLPVETMYLRSMMAAKACKYKYKTYIGFYEPQMETNMLQEHEIINDMETALAEKQFEVYLQPQYNLRTMMPYGAEALVRWHHPRKGLIMPGVFIPIFEQNDFIARLDFYVWDEVCRLLKRWQDEGKEYGPISVNMSRVDLYNPNLVQILCALVQKYDISPHLLNLELTESAYVDDPTLISSKISQLQKAGFTVMMDDFGSGYSSLKTLKDVCVDFLKIDMNFLKGGIDDSRSKRVLTSVINMASWLETPIIVEGVEKKEQCEFLESIGCGFIQGFYFSKPMPIPQYEQLCDGILKTMQEKVKLGQQMGKPLKELDHQQLIELIWPTHKGSEQILESFPQAVGLFEFGKGNVRLLRANKAYRQIFFDIADEVNPQLLNLLKQGHLNKKDTDKLLTTFKKAVRNGGTVGADFQYKFGQGNKTYEKSFRLCLNCLGTNGGNYVLLGTYVSLLDELDLSREMTPVNKKTMSAALPVINLPDLQVLMKGLNQLFTLARIVDPMDTSVVRLLENGKLEKKKYTCFHNWNYLQRCANCVSRNALRTDMIHFKYESDGKAAYVVMAKPVLIKSQDNYFHLVLEIVNQIKDKQLMEEKGHAWIEHYLKQKIYQDALTNTFNRRYLDEMEFCQQSTDNSIDKMAVIMMDLHRFKEVNDNYGHAVGDYVLKQVSDVLMTHVRGSDAVIRLGGDEFLLLLKDCAEKVVAEKMRELKQHVSTVTYGKNEHVTLDAGYAFSDNFVATDEALQHLIKQADKEMYKDKQKRDAQEKQEEAKKILSDPLPKPYCD